ncbi:MAG TPA: response regulator [Xanthobacteraceae bacterium]|jgi:CheY-like chemotaxis protein
MASVLVIDDDPAVSLTIKLVLERDGHDVVLAGDGQSGVEALETGQFQLLIVDIFMPAMDGLETIRAVHNRQPALPVIVVSGASSQFLDIAPRPPDFLAMAVKLGAVRGIQKPFRPNDLTNVVNECLRGETAAKRDVAK